MRIPRGEEGEGESIEQHHVPKEEKEEVHDTTRSISSPTDIAEETEHVSEEKKEQIEEPISSRTECGIPSDGVTTSNFLSSKVIYHGGFRHKS